MSSEEASQRRESQGRLGERREASLVKGESKRRQTAGEGRARGGLGGDQQNWTGTLLGVGMEGGRACQGEHSQTLQSLENRTQGCQPPATGSRAALGRQSWIHHVGGAEGSRKLLRGRPWWSERDGDKKSRPSLLRHERDVKWARSTPPVKKKKNRQLPEYFPVAFHGRFGSSSQRSCLYLEHSRRGTEVQNDNSKGRACLSMPFTSEINYLQ